MTSSRVRRNPPNAAGRDFVVGDVHGCFRTLERALVELRFDPVCDRLFGVGDLVDRGPHSAEALVWIERRFEAVVMGNHERPLLYWFDPHRRPSSAHRPQWLRRAPRSPHGRWRAAIVRMPLAVTIETPYGPVGVVHADVPHPDWAVATAMLEAGAPHLVDIAQLGIGAPEVEVRHTAAKRSRGFGCWSTGTSWWMMCSGSPTAGTPIPDRASPAATGLLSCTSTRGVITRARSMLTRRLEPSSAASPISALSQVPSAARSRTWLAPSRALAHPTFGDRKPAR